MSESVHAEVEQEVKTDVASESARLGISQAEYVRRSVREKLQRGDTDGEIKRLRDELQDRKENRREEERKIEEIEDRLETLEKQKQGQEAVNEEYQELVEKIAYFDIEYNPKTYTAHEDWERAVKISDQSEAEVRADVEDKIESLAGGTL